VSRATTRTVAILSAVALEAGALAVVLIVAAFRLDRTAAR